MDRVRTAAALAGDPGDLLWQAVPARRNVSQGAHGFTSKPLSWRDKLASFLGGDTREGYQRAQGALGYRPGSSPEASVARFFDPREAASRTADALQSGEPATAALESPVGPGKIGKIGKAVLIGAGGLAIDKKALQLAQEMRMALKSPEDIWRETKWADIAGNTPWTKTGPDQWVTELPDTPGAYSPPPQGAAPLEEYYKEPGYYENYPQARQTPFKRLYAGPEVGGQYNFDPSSIAINPKRPREGQEKSFHHELFHRTSHQEGWPSGASGSTYAVYPGSPSWPIFVETLDKHRSNPWSWDEFSSKFKNATEQQYRQYLAEAKKTENQIDWESPLIGLAEQQAQFEAYRRDRGERTAREAATRFTWSPEKRLMVPPGSPLGSDIAKELETPGKVRPWTGVKPVNPEWPY